MTDSETATTPSADFIVFADDWGRHPSSCQHLIRRLREHSRVLWVNSIGTRQPKADGFTVRRGVEKLRSWAAGVRRVSEKMWVTELPMVPGIGGRLVRPLNQRLVKTRLRRCIESLGLSTPVVFTTLPYTSWLIGDLSRRGLVYYCTDDFSNWPSADRATLLAAERDLVRDCDLILAASRALESRFKDTGRCHYLPHGVDFEHFARAQSASSLPVELSKIPGPRIGFFGLVYEKLDFELLHRIATRFGSCQLILLGRVDYCPSEFASLPNVHLLGPKPYEELPEWIAGLDVLLLPYLMNDEMIRLSGPLKLRECLASGKPTVGVDIPDIRALAPHVRVGTDATDFCDQLREALAETHDKLATNRRQDSVRCDGWESRFTQLHGYIESLPRINGRQRKSNAKSTRAGKLERPREGR